MSTSLMEDRPVTDDLPMSHDMAVRLLKEYVSSLKDFSTLLKIKQNVETKDSATSPLHSPLNDESSNLDTVRLASKKFSSQKCSVSNNSEDNIHRNVANGNILSGIKNGSNKRIRNKEIFRDVNRSLKKSESSGLYPVTKTEPSISNREPSDESGRQTPVNVESRYYGTGVYQLSDNDVKMLPPVGPTVPSQPTNQNKFCDKLDIAHFCAEIGMTQTDYTMKAENQRNLASVHVPAGNLKSEVALIRPFTQMLWPTDNSEVQEVPLNSLQKSSIDIRTSPISVPNMYPNNVQKHRHSETNVALSDSVHKLASGKLSCWRTNEVRIEGVNKLDWYENKSHLPTRQPRRFYSHKVNLVNGSVRATRTGSPVEFGRNGSVVDQIGSASPTLSEQSTESAPILRYKDELTVVLPSEIGRTNSSNRHTRTLCEWRKSTQQDTTRSSITPPGKWTQKTESQFTLPSDKQTGNSSISRNSVDGSVPSSSDLNQLAFGPVSPGVVDRFSPTHSVFEGRQQNSMLLGSVSPRPNNMADIRQRRTIGLDVSESSWKPPDYQADAVKRALMEFRRSSLGLPSSPSTPPIAPTAGTVSSRIRSGISERPVISTSKFSSQVSEAAGLTVSNRPSSVSSPNTFWVGCRSFSGSSQTDVQRPLSVSVDPPTGCSNTAYASLRSIQQTKLNAATQTVDDCSSPNSLTPTELTCPPEISENGSPSSTDWAGPSEPEQVGLETWPLSLQSIVTTPSLENADNKLEPMQVNPAVGTRHTRGFNLDSSPPISTMRIESAHNSAFTQPFLRRFSLRATRPISLDSTRQSASNRLSLLRPTRASTGTPINANNVRPDSQRCRSVHFSTDVLVAHSGVGQEPLLLSSAPLKEPAPVDEPQSKPNVPLRSSKRVLYNSRAASDFGPGEPSPHGSSIAPQSYQAAKSYT
ncbi:hypothetical protein EG68_02343 [Paragonimus skrjabini miyazakii]|uniref:Uncharacterized protein n=1 Tax=Paragonimus skrjabini miyazakii TaxID=59628 RepID=A0A8S9Z405_9TREM|nr:hypothetical protein EG68_02343 [Paragonimus skrjabini miyazakii]